MQQEQQYNKIVEELLIDSEASGKMHRSLDELMSEVPPLGIAHVKEKFNYFFGKSHGKVFNEGDNVVLFAYVYMSIVNAGEKYENCLEPSGKKFSDYYTPYNGQDLTDKKILIWRNGGIGDIIFIQPLMRYLKMRYPTCKIYFACAPAYFDFLKTWGDLIDELLAAPFILDILEETDYHVTFEGVIERCKEAEDINAYKLFSKRMGLNLPESILRPILKTTGEANENTSRYLSQNRIAEKDFICLQLRSSSPVRTPPLDVWSRFITPLVEKGHKIIICDSPDVAEQIDQMVDVIVKDKNLHNQIYNFSHKSKSLNDAISLINKSKMVIAPDSSFVHIAGGLNIPVVGIYAPFDAELRMSTYGTHLWIQPEKDDNRICSYGGRRCFLHGTKCPVNINLASPCFYNIDFELANIKIQNLLETL